MSARGSRYFSLTTLGCIVGSSGCGVSKASRPLQRLGFLSLALRIVYLRTARGCLAAPFREIALRDGPVVVELRAAILDDGDADLGAVARGDGMVVFSAGRPAA